jgi:hypothetical protein
MGLCRVLEEEPLLRTGAPASSTCIYMNNVAGFHSSPAVVINNEKQK